jgi:Protein of unknown function (DUF3617)
MNRCTWGWPAVVVNLPTRLIAEQVRGPHRGRQSLPFSLKKTRKLPLQHSVDVCLTQALIDKYGAPLPHISGDCHITRLNKKANSMSAEMVFRPPSAKATMQSSWTADHATGSVHFVGMAPKP